MGLRDMLRGLGMRPDETDAPMPGFDVTFDDDGANFVTTASDLELLRRGQGQRTAQEQHLVLEMLAEQGAARPLPNGFEMDAEDVARLSDEEAEIVGLPPRFPGTFVAEVRSNTTSQRFAVTILAHSGASPQPSNRLGPTLRLGSATSYRLSLPALRALRAVEEHSRLDLDERTESRNVRLVAELQGANRLAAEGPEESRDPSFRLSLGHLDSWSTTVPESVGLVVEPGTDGSLKVTPDLGTDVDTATLDRRWRQLDEESDTGVLRVDDELILLEEKQLAGVRNVLSNRTIPKHQVPTFLKAPGSFFDTALVDVELHFGVRVAGVGVVTQSFVEASESGISWFDDGATVKPARVLPDLIQDLASLTAVERDVDEAWTAGRTVVPVAEELVDVSDHDAVQEALVLTRARLRRQHESRPPAGARERTVAVGVVIGDALPLTDLLRARVADVSPPRAVPYADLLRAPYPHQREGIELLSALMAASLDGDADAPDRVQGALLADDMGLGKTYMTLVALRELMAAQDARDERRPTLAVLPVSLIENWEGELRETFAGPVFDDVVVLQSGRDLGRFRIGGAGRETSAIASNVGNDGMLREDAIRLSLRVGDAHGPARLDVPGRLVLATYETLASYQLSLAQVDWGAVVFDEAQNIKNPDALRTRAAKGLKARFKLLATGTPIENSLLDFWCLMDTAQPGLLGSWPTFQEAWVTPMDGADGERKAELGRGLREEVGPFMLRRVKEDHLPDLPTKTVHSGVPAPGTDIAHDPRLALTMPPPQQAAYDAHVQAFQARAQRSQGAALKAIQALRAVSLHPDAQGDSALAKDPSGLELSARMRAMLPVLDDIRSRGEKVIIFVVNKKVQQHLALWLHQRYGLPVRVVNGDTAAVSKGGGETRRRIIQDFEAEPGFNLIIMSPLAVGVGLTIVGANHAIHLERHWNPAKEAQATDRIYRIGQTRPVHVYLPIALHPHHDSFDLNLDRLLRQKTTLKDAVVVPETVDEAELATTMGLLD
ncbi:helicase-like protein [Georgenia muralis]|uniref:Helicase-like protein n=2 Tax=Georgenia muralis TaxID=154117 RepID=A0A3N4ZU49_9MICO|nr:helicase-like protein [Georgenia muralis]